MITFISWAIILGLSAYVAAAPDRRSLTASRGLWGAFRGWANPQYAAAKTKAAETKADKGKNGKSKARASRAAQGSRWHGMLAGWNAGVTVARQRRSEGRDLWSIGSKFAGRTWGGGESLVVGVRRLRADLGAWYRGRQYAADGPVVQGTVIDDEPDDEPETPTRTNRDPAFTTVSESGEMHDSVRYSEVVHDSDYYDLGRPRVVQACNRCANKKTAGDVEGLDPALAREDTTFLFSAPLDLTAGRTFTCPVCGETYDATTYPRPSKDLAAMQAAGGAPAEGAGAPSPTPSTTNQHKEIKTMNMQLTELTNVNELDMELEAIEGVLEETMAGLAKVDEWANLLPERWEATDYSTKGLDQAIAGIPESFSIKAETSALLEQIAVARQEIKAAQEFGEMADSVGATGNVAGFRAS